jgi:hypothetical protein
VAADRPVDSADPGDAHGGHAALRASVGPHNMSRITIGVNLPPQRTSYAEYREAWLHADALGVDAIWNWDHSATDIADRPRCTLPCVWVN